MSMNCTINLALKVQTLAGCTVPACGDCPFLVRIPFHGMGCIVFDQRLENVQLHGMTVLRRCQECIEAQRRHQRLTSPKLLDGKTGKPFRLKPRTIKPGDCDCILPEVVVHKATGRYGCVSCDRYLGKERSEQEDIHRRAHGLPTASESRADEGQHEDVSPAKRGDLWSEVNPSE